MKFASSQDDCLYFTDHTDEMVQEQLDDTLDPDRYWIENEEDDEDKPPKVELKALPDHLEYAFLQGDDKLSVVISSSLSAMQKGIDPSFCTYKILMEEVYKPCVQPQRRLNPNLKEVVKKEVIKLLDVGIIYHTSDSPWVSPIQVVPKKGSMTVVRNEKNELIPQCTVIGWRVCIDYRKRNDATRKIIFLFHSLIKCSNDSPA
ncbi:hypothetical protein Tco_0050712 [Tanacetum coccineum]